MPKLSVRKCCSEMLSSKSLLKEPIFLQPSLRDKHTNTNTNTTTMTVTMTSTNILTVASSLSSCSLPFLEPLTLSFLLFRISQLCVQRAVFSFPPLLHPPTVRRSPIPGWMMTPCLNFFGHSNQSSISLKSLILKTPPF